MRTGYYISGFGHALLILWVLFGGLFLRAREPVSVETTQVSLISPEEFAQIATPSVAPDVDTEVEPPAQPEPDVPAEPEPVQPEETAPEVPEQPEQIIAEPTEAPEITEVAPNPVVPDEPQIVPLAPVAPEAVERPADRVAPEPVINDTPEQPIDVVTQEAAETAEDTPPDPVEEPVEETTVQEEASNKIVAEAIEPPKSSPRPPSRPERPQPVVEQPEEPEEPDQPEQQDDILAALNEANETPAPSEAPQPASGPPLTFGEKESLRVAVSQCWNVGALSGEALRTTVVASLSVGRDGVPDATSVRMIDYSGGSKDAADRAFAAARRAIIMCGSKGFNLPAEKYDHWKEIEITFDPVKMRNR
ncbi:MULTISPECIES: energy transducer TonB [Halocynthiibacter]|uniref:Energy transducer TonB n=1 Tax=Halocynthiibacter halioticoli TaxID=2986804 RepID=A0AAE3J278_9RHOB|nr:MULTISPECIES: energy transducer TonB [Halocynthiibacter]MCV6825293.1 energy transducer TonB [Halocynthiibacter halioticoli]MCW4058294.1 energy transducer TonB [Halocynthiibacter sp. SDUM655004]